MSSEYCAGAYVTVFLRPTAPVLSASRSGSRQQAQLAHHCLCLKLSPTESAALPLMLPLPNLPLELSCFCTLPPHACTISSYIDSISYYHATCAHGSPLYHVALMHHVQPSRCPCTYQDLYTDHKSAPHTRTCAPLTRTS